MQSYCIYAEAFAGPFRPLRAPEPPFTHKTPPFTQVLFLLWYNQFKKIVVSMQLQNGK